ncbi:MAG: hypothetical protein ACR2L8_03310 [Solirubrobacteraceae bacterium]
MGRRSRKRGDAIVRPVPAPATPPARGERPRAPWHPLPLVELSVLIGLGLLVWGLIRRDDDGGRVLLVCGLALASLGGLDTALREHFAGFKPHALLLAALPAVLTAGVLFFARAPGIVIPLAGAVVFAAAFAGLRRAFRRGH